MANPHLPEVSGTFLALVSHALPVNNSYVVVPCSNYVAIHVLFRV